MTNPGKVRLIAAIGPEHELAYVGDPAIPYGMLWEVPTDMAFFHEQSKKFGGIVLLGADTYRVFGRPLSGRQTFVLSHTIKPTEGITILSDAGLFLSEQRALGHDVWVAGGQSVYEQTIPEADELWLTRINGPLKRPANRWFPEFLHTFRLMSQQPLESENGYTYQFEVYERLQNQ